MVEALIGDDSSGRSDRRCLLSPSSLSCDSLRFMYAQLAAHGSVKTFCSISVYLLAFGRGFACYFSVSMRSIDLHLGPMFERGRTERRKKDGKGANWKYRDYGFVHGVLDLDMDIDDGFSFMYRCRSWNRRPAIILCIGSSYVHFVL